MIGKRDYYGSEFLPFVGVVEDGEGTVGRVRVRVFGIHPFDAFGSKFTGAGSQAVSTGDLPWAVVVKGVGDTSSHHALKIGDWVYGFWADGLRCQQPVVLGRIQRMDGTIGEVFRKGSSASSGSGGQDVTGGTGNAGNDSPVKINRNTYYNIVPGDTNPEKVFNLLATYFSEEKGMSEEQAKQVAAGIVTSLKFESGKSLNPTAVGDSGTAYGIAQWRHERRRGLNQMCGTNSNSVVCQANFIITELEDRGHSVFSENSKKSVLNKLMNARSAFDAAYIWTYYYEIPANRKQKSEERARAAPKVYQELAPKFQRASKGYLSS